MVRLAQFEQPVFATTHWSVVLAAGRSESPGAFHALEALCRTYWYPLYAHARRIGHDVHLAEDVTQEFFARLLEKNYLNIADRRRGKFRWFLLTAFKCFLANEWDRARALKRGGGERAIALDALTAEDRLRLEPANTLTADLLFDRRWALTLLETARLALKREYDDSAKSRRFEQLEAALPGDRRERTYSQIATELGTTESALKVEVHRMKRRYAKLLRDEVAKTVRNHGEVDEEIRHLMDVLSRR
jgi:DNA-directed RNA polymerase specialized sigma24 family protein